MVRPNQELGNFFVRLGLLVLEMSERMAELGVYERRSRHSSYQFDVLCEGLESFAIRLQNRNGYCTRLARIDIFHDAGFASMSASSDPALSTVFEFVVGVCVHVHILPLFPGWAYPPPRTFMP
ncbi:hypothetical protein D3C86_1706940 [compost metagenome]